MLMAGVIQRDSGFIDDLSRTRGDPLLSSLRYRLKKDYALPLGEKALHYREHCPDEVFP